MAGTQKSKSGGARKYGRNKERCARYALAQRRYKNKVRQARKRYGRCTKEVLDKVLNSIKFS